MVGLLKSIVRRLANVANFCKKTTVDKELIPVGLYALGARGYALQETPWWQSAIILLGE